jgi:hypothetical protein
MFGGFAGTVEDVLLEQRELQPEERHLLVVHVFRVRHRQQFGVGQLLDRLVFQLLASLGSFLVAEGSGGTINGAAGQLHVAGLGGGGGHRLRHRRHGQRGPAATTACLAAGLALAAGFAAGLLAAALALAAGLAGAFLAGAFTSCLLAAPAVAWASREPADLLCSDDVGPS